VSPLPGDGPFARILQLTFHFIETIPPIIFLPGTGLCHFATQSVRITTPVRFSAFDSYTNHEVIDEASRLSYCRSPCHPPASWVR
jgi:hypothetical protein